MKSGIDVPLQLVVGFQQRARLNSQELLDDSFFRHRDTFAQYVFGTEKYPDAGINSSFVDDKYCQGYDEIVSCFMQLR